jgi:hypothetical protein
VVVVAWLAYLFPVLASAGLFIINFVVADEEGLTDQEVADKVPGIVVPAIVAVCPSNPPSMYGKEPSTCCPLALLEISKTNKKKK